MSGTDDGVRIIKHGRFYNKVVRFECNCGCVYETVYASFRVICGNVVEYWCDCPDCGERNMKSESMDEEPGRETTSNDAEPDEHNAIEQKKPNQAETRKCVFLVRPGICGGFLTACCPYQSVDHEGTRTTKPGECLCSYPNVSMPEPYYTALRGIQDAINGEVSGDE